MKVNYIRYVFTVQTDSSPVLDYRNFHFEVYTSGWKSGHRNRRRTFQYLDGVYQYLNKLLKGNWMTEYEYEQGWDITLRLEVDLKKIGLYRALTSDEKTAYMLYSAWMFGEEPADHLPDLCVPSSTLTTKVSWT